MDAGFKKVAGSSLEIGLSRNRRPGAASFSMMVVVPCAYVSAAVKMGLTVG